MKVAELVVALQKFPGDLDVYGAATHEDASNSAMGPFSTVGFYRSLQLARNMPGLPEGVCIGMQLEALIKLKGDA